MLTEAQQAEFRERGVIVLESAYSEQDLEPLRVQHQRWIEESREHDGPFGEMLDGRPRFDVEPLHSALAPALRRVASPEEISDEFLYLIESGPMLERLKQAVIDNDNVFDVLMDAVHVCSLGQITHALFEVGGQYRRNM